MWHDTLLLPQPKYSPHHFRFNVCEALNCRTPLISSRCLGNSFEELFWGLGKYGKDRNDLLWITRNRQIRLLGRPFAERTTDKFVINISRSFWNSVARKCVVRQERKWIIAKPWAYGILVAKHQLLCLKGVDFQIIYTSPPELLIDE